MMGRKSGQIEMLIFNPEDIIPKNHILRKIDKIVSFEGPVEKGGRVY